MVASMRRARSAAASLAALAALTILSAPSVRAVEGAVLEYPIQTADSFPWSIATGPDGNLQFTEYPLPTANSNPIGITPGPDGNLWFTESGTNRVASITTAGMITEYSVP